MLVLGCSVLHNQEEKDAFINVFIRFREEEVILGNMKYRVTLDDIQEDGDTVTRITIRSILLPVNRIVSDEKYSFHEYLEYMSPLINEYLNKYTF